MDEIHRAALGRQASFGDLYDARTDQFCGTSILDSEPPESALISYDIDSTRTEMISSDTMSERLKALEVESELKASVIAGLTKNITGHAACLCDERNLGPGAVSSSLLYSITTKVWFFSKWLCIVEYVERQYIVGGGP